MKLHFNKVKTELKQFAVKLLSQFCLIVFLTLFVAAAQGALSLPLALLLGAGNLVLLNVLCGLLLARPTATAKPLPTTTPQTTAPVQPTVVYRARRAARRPLTTLHPGSAA